MSDKPVVHTEDLGNTEYDGNRRARAEQASDKAPATGRPKTEPLTGADGAPDDRLAQKGTGEAAVSRRGTGI